MIGDKLIIYGIIVLLSTNFINYKISHFFGVKEGKIKERVEWEKSVKKLKDDHEGILENLKKGEGEVPNIIDAETGKFNEANQRALQTIIRMEGEIQSLRWRLINANEVEDDGCVYKPIPDQWLRQQSKLDSILQGL